MKRLFVPNVIRALSVITFASSVYTATCAHAADPQTDIPAPDALAHTATVTPGVSPGASPAADTGPAPVVQIASPAPASDIAADPRQVECMAKVIVHEAGNQVRRGQMAVAQVIRTRMKKFGAGNDVCAIVKQPGQFFNVDRYAPARASATWINAVAIATETLKGGGEDIVPGALFFRAAGHPMKGRERVARIDNHVFYR